MFIVFDMDGTLSDPTHRLHHLKNKDWDSFYEACDQDTPHDEMLNLMHSLYAAAHRIEIWTGRRESTREKTIQWMQDLELPNVPIRMRADGDKRHDVTVKGEWIDKYGKPDIVFEDRNSMVNFYRDQDIRCLQVAPGDF